MAFEANNAKSSNLVVVVAGFDSERIEKELKTAFKLCNIGFPLNINDFRKEEFVDCSVFYWAEKNSFWGVYVLIEPTVTSLIEIVNIVLSAGYSVIYYGGHGSADINSLGDWVLSEDDIHHDGLFTANMLEELLAQPGVGYGEIFLNCCFSNKWQEKIQNIQTIHNSSATYLQLRANDLEKDVDNNIMFSCHRSTILACLIDTIPLDDTTITSEIRKGNRFKLLTPFDSNASMDCFRAIAELGPVAGNPPRHSLALYVFSNGGSGDNYLLTGDDGATNIIIDGNHGSYFRKAWARVLGKIQSFDLVIGTHTDNDHIKGLEVLMTSPVARARVQTLWLNSPDLNVAAHIQMRDPKTAANVLRHYHVSNNYEDIVFGLSKVVNSTTTVTVLWPTQEYLTANRLSHENSEIVNNLSIISVINTVRNGVTTRMLFPGDADYGTLLNALTDNNMIDTIFDLVALPHHGSVLSNRSVVVNPLSKVRETLWVHNVVKSKRYVLTGNRTNSSDEDTTPSKALCLLLDNLLGANNDLQVYLTHEKFKCENYFPTQYLSDRIVVAVDGQMIIEF